MADQPAQTPSEGWRPTPLELKTPSVARMYDYLLGGKDNLAIDRERAEEAMAADPLLRLVVRENRAFLGRAVHYLAAECGIDQFIDIGTGLPTQDNVHQIAQRANPEARVVYVDNDPVVLAHGRALLASDDRTTIVTADLRDADRIMSHPDVARMIDFDRPVGLLMLAILHFVLDKDEPYRILDGLRAKLPSGSHLVITHGSADRRPDIVRRVEEIYSRTASPAVPRSHAEVSRFFGDFEFVDPGLIWVPWWRPDREPDENADSVWFLGGVARKP